MVQESHIESALSELGKTEQSRTELCFCIILQSFCASCMHAVFHLGISSYLHKCVIKAEWEMERLIDFTWVTQ